MCQARPGVRCTSHARESLNRARQDFDEALSEWNAVKNARSSSSKTEKLDALEMAQDKLHRAEQDYYSSPGGLKELKSSLQAYDRNSPEFARIQAQVELAEHDRDTQNLAYHLHQGHKSNIPNAMRTQHEILKSRERAQSESLARAMNTKGSDLLKEKANMRLATAQKRSHEELMRLKAVGIDDRKVEYSYMRDIIPQRNERDIYLPLNGGDLGRAREYFPFGTYGKVTELKRDGSSGALYANIEGKLWKPVSGYDKVLHFSRET